MRRPLLIILFIACAGVLSAQTPALNDAYLQYIAKYRKVALEQEKQHKIPACITLAQGLLESGAGKSELATQANNHFGIKCHKDWTGETYSHDDETAQECFRKYKHAEESYEDHSLFLQRPRYATLFQLDITDYKGWAHGLRQCGYATDPTYAAKLIKIIEDYGLAETSDAPVQTKTAAELQKAAVSTPSNEESAPTDIVAKTLGKDKKVSATMGELSLFTEHEVHYERMVRWVIAELGDTYETIADEFNIEVSRLRKYNNAKYGDQPEVAQKVYLTRHK
ncbi:MAG: glucosaminidase domain-containing protein [Paludibacteraceae bacterium]|nr:glucosaminidase domain-containing protein [Paludibacteraceae bacterium]